MPYDLNQMQSTYTDTNTGEASNNYLQTSNCVLQYPYVNYPSYIYIDKTKKAIDILRALEAKKLVEFKSVNKFLELVDEISKLV